MQRTVSTRRLAGAEYRRASQTHFAHPFRDALGKTGFVGAYRNSTYRIFVDRLSAGHYTWVAYLDAKRSGPGIGTQRSVLMAADDALRQIRARVDQTAGDATDKDRLPRSAGQPRTGPAFEAPFGDQ